MNVSDQVWPIFDAVKVSFGFGVGAVARNLHGQPAVGVVVERRRRRAMASDFDELREVVVDKGDVVTTDLSTDAVVRNLRAEDLADAVAELELPAGFADAEVDVDRVAVDVVVMLPLENNGSFGGWGSA